MKKAIILLSMGSLLLWSCNSNNQDLAKNATEVHEAHADHDEHEGDEHEHHADASEAIELDNGAKWKVNEEMKPFVLKGEELVNNFIKDKGADFKGLAEAIESENSRLIKSCTMDGKSHEELHKWLHPHLELVEALAKETNPQRSEEIVAKLQHSYHFYHLYFE